MTTKLKPVTAFAPFRPRQVTRPKQTASMLHVHVPTERNSFELLTRTITTMNEHSKLSQVISADTEPHVLTQSANSTSHLCMEDDSAAANFLSSQVRPDGCQL
ncbi:hypothetical protein Plhal304r1_c048g0130371 [Plasmopara halstedii]